MDNLDYKIVKALPEDIKDVSQLYDSVNDSLAENSFCPGWIKGVYPNADTARIAAEKKNLFVLKNNNSIIGAVILDSSQVETYKNVNWSIKAPDSEVLVVHTLVVSPLTTKKGLGKKLVGFAIEYAKSQKIKTIRLDVSIHNLPAIALYEKLGFNYVETFDLGLGEGKLKWFKAYELKI